MSYENFSPGTPLIDRPALAPPPPPAEIPPGRFPAAATAATNTAMNSNPPRLGPPAPQRGTNSNYNVYNSGN